MEISFQDLLIQVSRIRILEWQIPAYQRKHNDAAAPYVNARPVVFLPRYHFGRGIAGRAAGCTQGFTGGIGVGEAKVYYFDVVVRVEQ